MNPVVERLMRGAIDMHIHTYPELSFRCHSRLEDYDTAVLAREYGMRAMVLKSHFWPTVGSVYHLRRLVEGIGIFPSVTLNITAGGVSPWVVEAAAQQGAKVVWMPTWSAANDMIHNAFYTKLMAETLPSFKGLKPVEGLCIIDDTGKLTVAACEVLEVVKQYDMAIFTGHISLKESFALVDEAAKRGIQKIVLGHPDNSAIHATDDEVLEIARRGALIEFVALGTVPMIQRTSPRKMAKLIRDIGAEKILIDTDSFHDWIPPAPEMLRMFLAGLLDSGLTEEALIAGVQRNPAWLLGLE